MKLLLSACALGMAVGCGPITKKEEGGDLEFQVDLQNDADVPLTVRVVFDLCKIEDAKAEQVAAAHARFSHTFVGECASDDDYDKNDERIVLSSSTGKHDVSLTSGCRQAARCDNEGCTTKQDANCKAQPEPSSPPVP